MKLKWFRVREFQSVKDSGVIDAGDITCFVGKNESGKTALLKALYRLNPLVDSQGKFDVATDFPRMDVEDYRYDVEVGIREPVNPIEAAFSLEIDELADIERLFGPDCIPKDAEVRLSKNYDNKRTYAFQPDETRGLSYLIDSSELPENAKAALFGIPRDPTSLIAALEAMEQTEKTKELIETLTAIQKRRIAGYIVDRILYVPKFLYFDEFFQLSGHENIEALIQRQSENALKPSDHPLLGLINLSRLKLNELVNPASTIDLKNKLQGASNHLSRQVLKYWSQNEHLRIEFDVRRARAGDPAGMQQGTNIWGGVFDTHHHVTTELGTRSRGFVWFFSFLAWYSDIKRSPGPLILLLDEPGLTLHAKAQWDLLRYFEQELKGYNQLLYTTHSAFMVDPQHLDRVRIVQDRRNEENGDASNWGTQVFKDVSAASTDSLFPLLGALGYDLQQALFNDPYNLAVETAADLLYIESISSLLHREGRPGLDPRWTIVPVGGAAKVPIFVALLGNQGDRIVATLIDQNIVQSKGREGSPGDGLLKRANVLKFSDFTRTEEAGIEDMLGDAFYLDLVNEAFKEQLEQPIPLAAVNVGDPRIVRRIEDHLADNPMKHGQFSRYRLAKYFQENAQGLAQRLPELARERFEAVFSQLNELLPGAATPHKAQNGPPP